ncbi:MAG: hypothetical protein ABFC89_01275 [Methanospirillum sp.]
MTGGECSFLSPPREAACTFRRVVAVKRSFCSEDGWINVNDAG